MIIYQLIYDKANNIMISKSQSVFILPVKVMKIMSNVSRIVYISS